MTDPIPASPFEGDKFDAEARHFFVQSAVDEALRRHDVPSLVNGYGKLVPEFFEAQRAAWVAQIADDPEQAEYMQDRERFDLTVDALLQARASHHADLIMAVILQRLLVEEQPEIIGHINIAKKVLIASLMVDFEYDFNHPWITFINEMHPGETLTEQDIEKDLLRASIEEIDPDARVTEILDISPPDDE